MKMISKILCVVFASEMILYTSFGQVSFVKSQGDKQFLDRITKAKVLLLLLVCTKANKE